MPDRAFGELLREFRSASGLSQEQLAERAHMSPGAISALERRVRRSPQHQTLGMLAEALRLNASDRARLEASAVEGRRRGARPAPRNGAAVQHNIPNIVTSFRGREREIGDLAHLMKTRRLLTLLGPGGVGKTRLALESARGQLPAECFPDGVWFVELAPLASSDMLTAAIAARCDVRERSTEPLLDTVVVALRDKNLLLILDNCEHVIDECARVTERLGRECSQVTVLVTTREALRIEGECILRVEPLNFEDTNGGGAALALLSDRLVDADFSRYNVMSEDDLACVATICKHLDGIPLALELAAARARELSLRAIADGLDRRFVLLTHGSRTSSVRRRTLRGAIDWSFDLLSPAEQRTFARLGLFAEPFTPEAAVDVVSEAADIVRNALGGLIAKSLVSVVDDGHGDLRYRLLETMRAYAIDRLREAGEYGEFAARFARHFCAVAKRADSRYGRISNRDFLLSVEPEIDNFRAALEWCLLEKNDVVLGAELAGALGFVYRQTSMLFEGVRWCERALAENQKLPNAITGRLHMALSYFHFNMGEMNAARAATDLASEAYGGGDNPSDLAWALTQQSYCLYLQNRIDEAKLSVRAAIAFAREANDTFRLAGALNAFALTIPSERAGERYAPLQEAIRYYRESGDQGAIVPLSNLAEAKYANRDYEGALRSGLEVLSLTRAHHDKSNLAGALVNVAAYAVTLGDVDQAAQAAHEALTLVRPLGRTIYTMLALQHAGSVSVQRAEFARGARLLAASNRLYEEFGRSREFTEQSLYDQSMHAIRTALGEEQCARYLREGQDMALDQAINEALRVQ